MKTTHIIGILVIAVAIVVIITTTGDAGRYLSFAEAYEMAQKGSKTQIHVVGQLKRDATGQITGITPSPDMLSFRFVMVDQNGREEEVFYAKPVPTDFARSEQVVVIGSFRNDRFIADEILLKCPSKYQEEEIKV
jgi:cytochrome c-type biogenesis protein CcmE